jgi:hypothetical protein
MALSRFHPGDAITATLVSPLGTSRQVRLTLAQQP